MAEKAKYAVPRGMLKAAYDAQFGSFGPQKDSHFINLQAMEMCVEEALRWQSENPQVPTEKQERELYDAWEESKRSFTAPYTRFDHATAFGAIEWQRRMYLAPEPERKPITVIFPHTGTFMVEVFDDKPPCLRAKFEEILQNPKPKVPDAGVEGFGMLLQDVTQKKEKL